MKESEQSIISSHISNFINYLIRQLGRNGAVRVLDGKGNVYDDDVSTYHLCELLLQLDGDRYRKYIDDIVGYYCNNSASLQNPFMINTMVISGNNESEFVSQALAGLIDKGHLPTGLFSMYTAYLGAGDHFSTLWAVKILALSNRQKYNDVIHKALDKCCEDYDIFLKIPSHLGFLLKDIGLIENDEYKNVIDRIINDLLRTQKNGLWSDSAIATAYIIEDLFLYINREEVCEAITNAIRTLFNTKNGKSTELPKVLKREQDRCVESLFLQTLARISFIGSIWLKKEYNIDMGVESVKSVVGQYSFLYNTNLSFQEQIKKLADQVVDMEENFSHINKNVTKFWERSPFEKNVFVMMRYTDEVRFHLIEKYLRDEFGKHGLNVYLARDNQLVDDLWDNISIYMRACKYGVAVFEQAFKRDFNPNVSLELGFMLSRGRRVLLLKEKKLKALPTDVVGKLYQEFDIGKPETICKVVDKWVEDVVNTDKKSGV